MNSAGGLYILLGMLTQHIGKQVVVAVPVTLLIKRNQKEISPLECRQHSLATLRGFVSRRKHGIAQWRTEALKMGSMQQECLCRWWKLAQHFIAKVISQQSLTARDVRLVCLTASLAAGSERG